jgi:sugar phosphate isomerase/epimerase
MKYAICNETFVDWPLDRAFAFARECGYTGIEIAPFTLGPFVDAFDASTISAPRRREVRRLAESAGLAVVGLHWLLAKTSGLHLTSPDAAVRRRTAQYVVELVRMCRELGGDILVFGSPAQRNLAPGISRAQGMQYAADVFAQVVPELQSCGVTLALEPLGPAEGNFLLTAADAMELVRQLDSPHCRLHLDCKAMSTESQPIVSLIRQHAPVLAHFHANDPNRQGPGFGELDFVPILAALDEVGYQGWVSVEVFDYTPGSERLARDSIDYLRACEARLPRRSVRT